MNTARRASRVHSEQITPEHTSIDPAAADEESRSAERTPIILGVMAFIIALAIHWFPADAKPMTQSIDVRAVEQIYT